MQLICRAYSVAEDILRVGRWKMILIQPLNAKISGLIQNKLNLSIID